MPTDPTSADSVIGVYTTASRRKSTVLDGGGRTTDVGPWVQVSRLGMPLINEVIIPIGKKDFWNSTEPKNDAQFAANYAHPELAGLLPVLYPGVFPHLAAYTTDACRPGGDPPRRVSRRASSRASRTRPARRLPTCCA